MSELAPGDVHGDADRIAGHTPRGALQQAGHLGLILGETDNTSRPSTGECRRSQSREGRATGSRGPHPAVKPVHPVAYLWVIVKVSLIGVDLPLAFSAVIVAV